MLREVRISRIEMSASVSREKLVRQQCCARQVFYDSKLASLQNGHSLKSSTALLCWKKKKGLEERARFRKAPVRFGRPPSLTRKMRTSRSTCGGMGDALKEPCCARHVFYEAQK